MTRLRVLFAETNRGFRESMRSSSSPSQTRSLSSTPKTAPRRLPRPSPCAPHLVFADFGLLRLDALDLVRQVKQRLPETRVIVMLTADAKEYREAALEAGACATVAKPALNEDWMRMVLCLMRACRDSHQPPPDQLALLDDLEQEGYP